MFSSRKARVALTVASLVCCSWLAHPVARAQDASGLKGKGSVDDHARKFFEAGRAAYDVGNYSDALNYFQQAYELSERPQLLYNIGQCADRLRLDETALAAFRRYLERVPDAPNRYQVLERLKVLEEVASMKHEAAQLREPLADEPRPQSNGPNSAVAQSLMPRAEPTADSEPSLLSQWWVWAAAGGVVAVTVVVVLLATGGTETRTSERATGSNGRVIATLQLGDL